MEIFMVHLPDGQQVNWFQLGHVLSDMEIAAIFLPLLLSKKTRDTSIDETAKTYQDTR